MNRTKIIKLQNGGEKRICPNGEIGYYSYNMLHREDGPALIWHDGTKEWYKNGKLHRENGPDVEYNEGIKEWYKDGKRHREDGPAIIWANGSKEWYINGKRLKKEDFTSIEMVQQMNAWELFTPKELLEMKDGKYHR